ncbi:hypothetical protein [Anditalea andensis]
MPGYSREGIVFYAYPTAATGRIAMHQLYIQPNNTNFNHFYTTRVSERATALIRGIVKRSYLFMFLYNEKIIK